MSAPDVVRFTPRADQLCWTFGGVAPVQWIRPGQVLELWTEDCYAGKVHSPDDLVSRVCQFPFLNPQTGPFYVEGAAPGDTLALHFVSIEPSRDYGASTTVPFFGALTSTHTTAALHEALPEAVWIYDLDRAGRTVTFHARESDVSVLMPLDPMHGTVGVAPAAFEVRSALVPDTYGGNMDTPEMRAGVTAYFGVNVEGALFSLGDGHARQGEGESCGTAVEVAMDTVLIVELVRGATTPWPRIESDDAVMSVGSTRPLEDAYRVAQLDLVQLVSQTQGLNVLDAYQLVSQGGESPIANVCNPAYSIVSKIGKRYLPERDGIYRNVHAELREKASVYRAERGETSTRR